MTPACLEWTTCPSTTTCTALLGLVVVYATKTVNSDGTTWYVYLLYVFKPQLWGEHLPPLLRAVAIQIGLDQKPTIEDKKTHKIMTEENKKLNKIAASSALGTTDTTA